MEWTILCDFDGTIAVEDVTDLLLARFARPGWERLEQDWRAGRIGSRECMAGQVALLDATPAQLDAALEAVAIDPLFPAFVAAAQTRGMRVRVVSDGLDHAIARILARHGLGELPVVANHLRADGARGWRMQSPHARAHCTSGTCKCACADAVAGGSRQRTLLIGDGRSDFCVANQVDRVFAKDALIAHCREAGIAHDAIAGFADALALLPALHSGRPQPVHPVVAESLFVRVHSA